MCGIKGILGVDQKSSLDILAVNDVSHGMNRCFASTSLTGTHLQRTSGILDVIGENPQNGFGDDSSWDLTDPDWPHSGHLSNGRRRQATKALRASGLTREVQRLRPTAAREEQRSLEADLKEEHRRRQANALRPERPRPAAPLVLSEAFEIRSALRLSKMMKLGIPDCWSSGRRLSSEGAVLAGCLSAKDFVDRTHCVVYTRGDFVVHVQDSPCTAFGKAFQRTLNVSLLHLLSKHSG